MGALLVALLALAGVGRAFSDAQAHGSTRLTAWFPRWAGPHSWANKYRNGDPAQGPAFWGSTTLFVLATDCWHLMNAVTGAALDAAVLVAGWPVYRWYAVAAIVARRLVFQPIYAFLRKS